MSCSLSETEVRDDMRQCGVCIRNFSCGYCKSRRLRMSANILVYYKSIMKLATDTAFMPIVRLLCTHSIDQPMTHEHNQPITNE